MEEWRVIRSRHLNCNREDPRKTLADIEGPIDKSLGTKEALARLRKVAIAGEKTLQGAAELRTKQRLQV